MARSDPRETIPVHGDVPPAVGARPAQNGLSDGPRRDRRTTGPSARLAQSALPEDAVAVIEAPCRPATQSGKARSREWQLRFLPRRRPFVHSLTGWTGGEDPLAHLVLRFPSREAAARYARRQGLPYQTVEPARTPPPGPRPWSPEEATVSLCCWPTGPHPLCCGNYPFLKERGDDVTQ